MADCWSGGRELKLLVEQVSKNWNTHYLLLIKWRDYLQNVQYINKIQQYQSDYNAGIVDY